VAVLRETTRRALWIDVGRGIALAAMVTYHLAFDLTLLRLAELPVASLPWRIYAAGIASTFLFFAGVSLTYAHGDRIRWRPFLIRLAVITLCAAIVSLGTVFTIPAPIFFGILHAIALFSVLALPFLRAPLWLILGAVPVILVLPAVYADPLFSAPYFYPVGLSPYPPYTFDYEPIFPWFAVTLLGIAVGRLIAPPQPGASGYRRAGRLLRALAAAGRNSLVIYLVHQPILFAILMLVAMLMTALGIPVAGW